jgi:hypothetical protein
VKVQISDDELKGEGTIIQQHKALKSDKFRTEDDDKGNDVITCILTGPMTSLDGGNG